MMQHVRQNPLASELEFPQIMELHRIISEGKYDELRAFHQTNPYITMTYDVWMPSLPYQPGYRVSGTSALTHTRASPNDMIGVVETLYDIGMIGHHNEVNIYAQLRAYSYQDWPVILCLLSRILDRDDAVSIRVLYDDNDESCDLAQILNASICTHFYGKPIPMVRRMYERMMNMGFPKDLGLGQTFAPQYAESFLRDRPEPNYSAWLKMGDEGEDSSFLPVGG
jgi:hypothetical protein